MSANRDGTTANGRAKTFLTTFVWAPRSENAFLAVILGSKDGFETFLGAHKSVYGGSWNLGMMEIVLKRNFEKWPLSGPLIENASVFFRFPRAKRAPPTFQAVALALSYYYYYYS